MLLANFNRKEHLRHRAVSLRQHGFLVIIIITPGFTLLPDGSYRQIGITPRQSDPPLDCGLTAARNISDPRSPVV